MRKTAVAVVAVSLLLTFVFSCKAESGQSVEITLSAKDAVVGRLFNVSVTSSEIGNIVGGEFTLCYDDSVLEFKTANSDSFEVKTETYDDAVKIVFVIDDDGVSDEMLFDLRFKAKSNTHTHMKLVSSYVVDRGLDTVSAFGSCGVVINKNKSQKEDTIKDIAKASVYTSDTATSDNQSIKIYGSNNFESGKYVLASVVIVAVVSVNIWFMLSKKKSL